MATDAWQKTKGLMTRIFSHKKPDSAENISSELEASRARVIASQGIASEQIEQREIDRWEAQLRLKLLEDDATVTLVQELIDIAKGDHLIESAEIADISMRAHAKGNARIYQQGQGIQYNR